MVNNAAEKFTVGVFQISDLDDPEADVFQNLMISSLSKDTSLVKFSLRFDQKIYVKLLTVRQTNRQTDKRRLKHNLGGGNKPT